MGNRIENEYIIINKTAIQKRIEDLEVLKRIHCYIGSQPNENEFQRYNNEQSSLKQILSQSTPLIPEIDKAYWAGMQFVGEDKGSPNEYISNLKLDI